VIYFKYIFWMTTRLLTENRLMNARPLSDRVYKELKQDIFRCVLRPGQAVYEGELAVRYGASKTPIREALNTLRQEGYVQVMPRRGYLIAPISLQDVQQILALRLILEPAASEMAAQRVSPDELRQLRRLAQRSSGPNRSEQFPPDRAFHLAIAEASGNPRLAACIATLLEEVQRVYHLCPTLHEVEKAPPNRHLALVEALMQGNSHLARETMVQAIQDWRAWVIGSLLSSDAELGAPILIGAGAEVPLQTEAGPARAARRVAT
jgi:DNA-binding GntR family transcriptional regulator